MKILSTLVKILVVGIAIGGCSQGFAADTQNKTVPQSPQASSPSSNPVTADNDITSAIKQKIAMDDTVSGLNVTVTTQNSIVYLSGDVNTDKEASTLIQIAQATHGVKDVDAEKLNIKTSIQPFMDTVITAKVKGAFIRDKLIEGKDIPITTIDVETKDGKVYLTGSADNQDQVNNAIASAKSITNIKDVQAKITINKNNGTSTNNNTKSNNPLSY